MNSGNKQITHISKFLSLVLRHKPQTIGITLDPNGWADVAELIEKSKQQNISLDLETLKQVVDTNDKKRFAFNNDYTKIRASQGHSVSVDLGYKPTTPPTFYTMVQPGKMLKAYRQMAWLKNKGSMFI